MTKYALTEKQAIAAAKKHAALPVVPELAMFRHMMSSAHVVKDLTGAVLDIPKGSIIRLLALGDSYILTFNGMTTVLDDDNGTALICD